MLGIRQHKLTETCGWYGMIALIAAYALTSFSVIEGDGLIYQLLNLSGGIGLMVVAAAKNVIQSVLLNIFWMIIGVAAIIRILF